jgi:hypothetical protein
MGDICKQSVKENMSREDSSEGSYICGQFCYSV